MTPAGIIHFWNDEVGEARWFNSDAALDAEIATRFGDAYRAAREGKLTDWEASAESSLALLLLLDQFPRNMFRGRAEAFATDALARRIARQAIERGFDTRIAPPLRGFFYLPLSHSEDLADQNRCVALIAKRLGKETEQYRFALLHREAIEKFGHFPARNAALGRTTTAEERAYLASDPGF